MAPTIRIDHEVYAWLQGQARPFDDTPNSVLRRLAKLDGGSTSGAPVVRARKARERGEKTRQDEFRVPILKILLKHGGQAPRMTVLTDMEKAMADLLTPYDKSDIQSGTIRWQKSAEYEVLAMRQAGLLKPVNAAPRGYWALTKMGEAAATGSSRNTHVGSGAGR